MGVVLRATHLELDAPVAIKVVREELAQREEVVSRLLFEARAAAKLRGRHIVRVSDVARLESGVPYIVMELLEGADLATILQERGALPVHEAVDYVIQACEGLAEAHALGIVHRDLKPENLFIAATPEGGVLKILDFGISKAVEGSLSCTPRATLTSAGNAVGSPYYMSPEQMRASRSVDARADIWSLGAILFELLTGRCPFDGDSIPSVCAKVLGDEPAPLRTLASDVPAELALIVDLCLRKDVAERFQNVDELGTALCAFVDGGGQLAADPSWRLASGISLKSSRASAASIQALARRSAITQRWQSVSRRVVQATLATVVVGGALTVWQIRKSPHFFGRDVPVAIADFTPAPAPPPLAPPAAIRLADVDVVATALAPTLGAQPSTSASANGVKPKPWRRPPPAWTPPPVKPAVTATPSAASAASAAEPKSAPASDAWDVEKWGGRY
jgi:serine/threonine-protein kinase